MLALPCLIWWFCLGSLIGLLSSWLIGNLCSKPAVEPEVKIIERYVDNPKHTERIEFLENEVLLINELKTQISNLQLIYPKILDRLQENPSEKMFTNTDSQIQSQQELLLEELRERCRKLDIESKINLRILEDREDELRRLRPPAIDLESAREAGFSIQHADQLEIIEGIGPKIAEVLRSADIQSFADLALCKPEKISTILNRAGANFRVADPTTWPDQAELASKNRWSSLKLLQDVLSAGKRKVGNT